MAARGGNEKVVEVLVANKADIQIKDTVSPSSPLACPGVPLCVVWGPLWHPVMGEGSYGRGGGG